MAVHNRKYWALTDSAATACRLLLAWARVPYLSRERPTKPADDWLEPACTSWSAESGLQRPKLSKISTQVDGVFWFPFLLSPSTNIFTGLAYDGIIP